MNNFSFSHLIALTDQVGIWEHCLFSTPDRKEGYSTDDNARALQVVLRTQSLLTKSEVDKLLATYLQFLISARTKVGFHQDLNADLTWKDDSDVTEGFGRAMSALGETAFSAPQAHQKLAAVFVFDEQVPLIAKAHSLRAMAQVITALSYRLQFDTQSPQLLPELKMRKQLKGDVPVNLPLDLKHEVERLGDELLSAYIQHSNTNWQWYEDVLTYDNGRLPLGLFVAHQVTGEQKYLVAAQTSLDFLISQTFDVKRDCFSFPGYKGWFPKDGKKAEFGQQPIEAGSTVEVCVLAYQLTHLQKYLDFANKAFEWYQGRNILGIDLRDVSTGGIKDGLESWGTNPNQGAESILSYALAQVALQQVTL